MLVAGEGGNGRRDWCLIVIGGLQELIPAIALDAELLFGSADLAGSIGVEVGLFELLNECFYVVGGGGDEWLFACESCLYGVMGVETDGAVEVVVAVFEFLDEGDGLFVGGGELSSHCISRD